MRDYNYYDKEMRKTIKRFGKIHKSRVRYDEGNLEESCGQCQFFQAPNSCAMVVGEVEAGGVCDVFTPPQRALGIMSAVTDQTVRKSKVRYPIKKSASDDERYTFSIIYRATNDEKKPDLDSHSEYMTASDIEETLRDYVRKGDRRIFLQHNPAGKVAGEWVNICVWPFDVETDFKLPDGSVRKSTIPQNSAWMGVIWEPWAWEMVKKGEITGLSFGGFAAVD